MNEDKFVIMLLLWSIMYNKKGHVVKKSMANKPTHAKNEK